MFYLFNDHTENIKFVIEILIIYIIIKYRHKVQTNIINIPEKIVEKLILDFKPKKLINKLPLKKYIKKEHNKQFVDLASYDIFNLKNKFKKECKETISDYGIGTCGPPSFFGTLDLHRELEIKITQILKTEDTVLYANSYTCIHSIISCFASRKDIIYYPFSCNESILRGISLSKSKCYEYYGIKNLENIFDNFYEPKIRNFVIVEGLSKNEGKITNLLELIKLKNKYDFKIILDESLSIPMISKTGIVELFKINQNEIDIRIGSFSYGFTSNGGFFTGSKVLCQYQRLSSSSYVFSASLPGVLTKFNILCLNLEFTYKKLRKKIHQFHKNFKSQKFEIISDKISPIIVFKCKNQIDFSAYKILQKLNKLNIYVSVNNRLKNLRIIIKKNCKNIKKLAMIIAKICDEI